MDTSWGVIPNRVWSDSLIVCAPALAWYHAFAGISPGVLPDPAENMGRTLDDRDRLLSAGDVQRGEFSCGGEVACWLLLFLRSLVRILIRMFLAHRSSRDRIPSPSRIKRRPGPGKKIITIPRIRITKPRPMMSHLFTLANLPPCPSPLSALFCLVSRCNLKLLHLPPGWNECDDARPSLVRACSSLRI